MPSKTYLTIALVMFSFSSSVLYSSGFNGIYSASGSSVWVVGNAGIIYRSVDGGVTYSDRSVGTENYNAISGSSPIIVIGGNNGTILYSTNAGLVFTAVNIGSADNIKSLSFANSTTGWAGCTNGKIYKTTNSGVNWVQQVSPSVSSLNSMKFINASTGVVCGDNGAMLITTNGGTNWVQAALPVQKKLFQVSAKGNTILAGAADGLVIKSTDLGNSWSVIDYKILTKPDISGIFLLDSIKFLSCGMGGFIRKSVNAGLSFTYQNNPAMLELGQIFMVDSNNGWILSTNSNVVLRTISGGVNWQLPSGTTQTLSWSLKLPLVFYTSSGNVFYQSAWNRNEIFFPKSNVVYRSLNLGDSWAQVGTAMPYGLISNSFFVSPKDTNVFLVAIDSSDNFHGKVLRSTNYGQSWTSVLGPFNRSSDGVPMAMDPNHSDTVYYSPSDSTLFRSTNFGLSWAPVGSHIFNNECIIKVLESNSNIIFVGSAGSPPDYVSHLARSTDFGATWTVVDSNLGDNQHYPEVPYISSSTLDSLLYITQYEGLTGGVKRSFNGGAGWSYINIDPFGWGLDVAKDDPNVLIYGVWQYIAPNAAYVSYDRGAHFTPLPYLSNSDNFSVYAYNRNTILLQQSMGIYKLRADITTPIGIQPISKEIPKGYLLGQNYPNPFNPVTKIKFDIPANTNGNVSLKIFDIRGREVVTLVNEILKPGEYEASFNGSGFASGSYFAKIEVYDKGASGIVYQNVIKMILIK